MTEVFLTFQKCSTLLFHFSLYPAASRTNQRIQIRYKYSKNIFSHLNINSIRPKTAEGKGGGESIWPLPCGFSKNVSSKERAKPWFFVTFTIILRHTFPENFMEFPQVVQKIWRNSLTLLANFHQFSSIFLIFWHYLVTKKLTTSAYNRWCQHFFTFSIL